MESRTGANSETANRVNAAYFLDEGTSTGHAPHHQHNPSADNSDQNLTQRSPPSSEKDEHGSGSSQQEGGGDNAQKENSKDEEQQDETPKPVGFWDPSLKHVRREAATKWIITTATLMAFILAVLSIYWGVFWRAEQHLHRLKIYIVDFDGQVAPYSDNGIQPLVGPTIVQLVNEQIASPEPGLGYTIAPASQFNYDPTAVRQAVYDFDAWAAIIVNANATAMLYSAVQSANTSYDPMGACQLIFTDSRDDTNWYDFISPQINTLMTSATSMVGKQWASVVLQDVISGTTSTSNLAAVPQALSPAIGFSMYNLRPFYPYTSIPAVSIGLIYLIIISFFSFAFYLPIHFKYLKPEGHPPLKFYQLIIWRWCSTISAYFMLSLAYSLISLAFQINFSGGNPVSSETEVTWTIDGYTNPTAYGYGTFPVYWMLNFFGMIALGLACENVAMFVGQPWTGLWLIFWVITNVSTAFYDIEIEPTFYRWGYAWPLHYVVEGSRQILFDLHSRIGLDFGVLIAWGAVNTAIFPLACWFMRWKSQHHVHEYYK